MGIEAPEDAVAVALVRELFADGSVRDLRRNRRLSQANCAHAVDVDPSTWSYWERGLKRPSDDACLLCAGLLPDLFGQELAS
jgi:DNA-binding transcriptional regulator YiaG